MYFNSCHYFRIALIFALEVMRHQQPTILYEDNHILAVNKPSGWLVQGDDTGDMPLSDWVKSYIKKKYNKPGDVYLGVLHRIDRPVSGIVLFARTSKAAVRMSKALQTHEIKKYYSAEIAGYPPAESGTLEHHITRNETNNTAKAHIKATPQSKPAKLEYRVIEKRASSTLIEILLHTGRHHQIRAQMAAIGCAIVGDLKYGYPKPNSDSSINLHACKVVFQHPVKQEDIEIKVPSRF